MTGLEVYIPGTGLVGCLVNTLDGYIVATRRLGTMTTLPKNQNLYTHTS